MTKPNNILGKDNPILRKKAEKVLPKEIDTDRIRNIVKRMQDAMHAEEDGVAIAAPQIGESLRIFLINGGVIDMIKKKLPEAVATQDLVFINPELIKLSKKKRLVEEGCLSVRWLYGKVERSERATITACNLEGKKKTFSASGLLAQIFQHEMDHLDGILFTDTAVDVIDLPPNKDVTL